TLLLSIGIALISLVTARPVVIAAISAVAWGILHFVTFRIQGIVVIWPFFVFSCAYLAWRPAGWLRAYGVPIGVHIPQNLLPGLAMLFVCQWPTRSRLLAPAVPIAVLLAGFLTTSLAALAPVDWTRFRGPNGSGVSAATNVPTEFGQTNKLAWRLPLPP